MLNMPEPFSGHHGHFVIGTGQPGAQRLDAHLTVPENSSTVTGTGLLTQAINPPLHANNAFHGLVHVLVFGGSTTQVYSLHGRPCRLSLARRMSLNS